MTVQIEIDSQHQTKKKRTHNSSRKKFFFSLISFTFFSSKSTLFKHHLKFMFSIAMEFNDNNTKCSILKNYFFFKCFYFVLFCFVFKFVRFFFLAIKFQKFFLNTTQTYYTLTKNKTKSPYASAKQMKLKLKHNKQRLK